MNSEQPWKKVSYAHQQPLYRVVNDEYKPKKRHYWNDRRKPAHMRSYTSQVHMNRHHKYGFEVEADVDIDDVKVDDVIVNEKMDAYVNTQENSINELSTRMDNLEVQQIRNYQTNNDSITVTDYDSISVTDYDILSAIKNDDIDRIQFLHRQEPDITRYNSHIPMCSGIRVLRYLVENGADIHEDDDAVLCWCSEKGYFDMVMYLVENGANIHARREHPFMFAANNGHIDIVKYLVDKGTDIHIRDDEALFRAVWWNKPQMVEYLISIGLTPYGWPADGSNYAWIQKHIDEPCVKILNEYFHILY